LLCGRVGTQDVLFGFLGSGSGIGKVEPQARKTSGNGLFGLVAEGSIFTGTTVVQWVCVEMLLLRFWGWWADAGVRGMWQVSCLVVWAGVSIREAVLTGGAAPDKVLLW